ncbi:SHOCT-like domain-containing protein [Allonocardiopsis opalescens]|uniref:YvlB/LiaX N-terminal domain-containing protein n=1 Tax=Allonocardiopsis opalescens TaxID=1144618 RepID=A0A2T0Q4U3_9ACTN|nr:hypothetical protein [Allonocardiopsis opalescens]PRX98837.1 hypothetical protein CLV72_104417 [Allonocardiopsis opalescens]
MNEQRRQILQMLPEGRISAEEAERLIDALDREGPDSPPHAPSAPPLRPTYLRVVVISVDGIDAEEPTRVDVRVPLRLLRAGVRLTALVPPQALTKVNAELRRSGVPIDLTELRPEHIEELIEQLDGLTVDVDDPDTKVRIYCE